ncbi:hypothetical protein evm_011971 [Chilo suppressalis]|nr:hypothetical protein evm_011971 [Chilo suppressalis]
MMKIDKVPFEEALNLTGFGKFNVISFLLCSSIIMGMAFELFSVSYLVPASACELMTTSNQQGLMAAVPLIAHSSQPTNVIIRSYLRASHTTFTESRSPLKNFIAPSAVSSAANVTSRLPLQFANSVGYVGDSGSLSDYIISDAVLQGYSEHSLFNSSLSDFKLVDQSSRECPRLGAVCHNWEDALVEDFRLETLRDG